MEQQNYQCNITVNATPDEAYKAIANVDKWWAKNFEGKALAKGDKFMVRFGTTWVNFDLTEAEPGKKVVWHVTDCHLPWLKDKTEWTGTDVQWGIKRNGDNSTTVNMTHAGLTPQVECYEACNDGWNGHIKNSLVNLINKGEGQPE